MLERVEDDVDFKRKYRITAEQRNVHPANVVTKENEVQNDGQSIVKQADGDERAC